ncbi:GTPase, G3E family [Mariniphaga anaerophila]|uniref:GTPase, G3E family n=1 Tax=Mariniphaga anaerophila TaxID=1484053 RepID=A0A1M5CC69_9BACT|nr:GTP-binding protein [Mariniphaga anaerophila]SHF52353.1 GTPase, G3E family [Mariniphaga anaerophila]
MKKIPFYIISGFLGSGKTTFVKRIIDSYSDKYKLGVIQNEFAPSNVDGEELKKSGKNFHLLEINRGSVFCVCLLGDFARSLEKFIDEYQPELLIIEASGLSDTTSVAEVISSGSLSEKMYLASNWCVVDAFNFNKAGLMRQRMGHQIRMADRVLVNKTDLVENADRTVNEIKKINPFARIQKTSFCDAPFYLKDDVVAKFYPDLAKPLARPDVNSMVIKSGKKFEEHALLQFLNKWAPKAYRIKGYANLKNGTVLAVQCVFENVECRLVENNFHPTELVALSDRFTLKEWNRSFKEHVGK